VIPDSERNQKNARKKEEAYSQTGETKETEARGAHKMVGNTGDVKRGINKARRDSRRTNRGSGTGHEPITR